MPYYLRYTLFMLANPVVFILLAFGFIVCTGLLLTFLNDVITERLEQHKAQIKARKRYLKRRPPTIHPLPPAKSPSAKTEEPFKIITVKTTSHDAAPTDLPKAA